MGGWAAGAAVPAVGWGDRRACGTPSCAAHRALLHPPTHPSPTHPPNHPTRLVHASSRRRRLCVLAGASRGARRRWRVLGRAAVPGAGPLAGALRHAGARQPWRGVGWRGLASGRRRRSVARAHPLRARFHACAPANLHSLPACPPASRPSTTASCTAPTTSSSTTAAPATSSTRWAGTEVGGVDSTERAGPGGRVRASERPRVAAAQSCRGLASATPGWLALRCLPNLAAHGRRRSACPQEAVTAPSWLSARAIQVGAPARPAGRRRMAAAPASSRLPRPLACPPAAARGPPSLPPYPSPALHPSSPFADPALPRTPAGHRGRRGRHEPDLAAPAAAQDAACAGRGAGRASGADRPAGGAGSAARQAPSRRPAGAQQAQQAQRAPAHARIRRCACRTPSLPDCIVRRAPPARP